MKGKRAKLAIDNKIKKELVGTHVRYMGLGGIRYVCPNCGRSFIRGFYYEADGKNGCTRGCLINQTEKVLHE
jgi:transposase-like protein